MFIAYASAILAAFLWGAGFIGSRYGLESLGPLWVSFGRFFIGFLVCLPVLAFGKKESWSKDKILGVTLCSIFLGGVMFLQIAGLQYTSVAKSGFITILYAIITPAFAGFFLRQKLGSYYWAMALIAFGGVCLLLDFDLNNFNGGDALTLGCAFCSALHILSVGRFAPRFESAAVFNVWQMFGVCALALPLALVFEGSKAPLIFLSELSFSDNALLGLLFMGAFSTGMGFFLQLWSQKHIRPHVASLIFLLESPMGAFLGWAMLSENIGIKEIIGCAITLFAVGAIPMEKPFQRGLSNVVRLYERRTKNKIDGRSGQSLMGDA